MSRSRSRAFEVLWAGFALANLTAMIVLTDWQTVPFHFIWVSLTLLYGWAFVWSWKKTMTWLLIVTITTGLALALDIQAAAAHHNEWDELSEIPLMATMFLASVWHVKQRQAAADRAAGLARSRQRLLDREREFLRDASHGLRTPIQIARGHAELLLREAPNLNALEDLDVILDELDRLGLISEQLLLLAAAEDPAFLRTRPMHLGRFAEQTLKRWEPAAERAWSLDVRWDGMVIADEERLRIAVDALIDNAIKYTQRGDRISIAVGLNDAGIAEFLLIDGGSGIDPGDLDRIFDRFSRDASPPNGHGSTGLGLSIVKAVVMAHGGHVDVASDPAGAGTSFRLHLPVVVAGSQYERPEPDPLAHVS